MVDIFSTLVQLVVTLGTLVVEIGALALQNALWIAWIAWWLGGVNWKKAWPMLAQGGWAVVVLLTVLGALVWSAIAPSSVTILGLFPLGNFWWQLGACTLLTLLALFCGYVQGAMHWAPMEISFDPPAHGHHGHHGHGHDHGHGHAHDHGHGHAADAGHGHGQAHGHH